MKNSFYNAWKDRHAPLDLSDVPADADATPTAEYEHRLEMVCADWDEYESVRGGLRETYAGDVNGYRAALVAEAEARAAMLELAADGLLFKLDESESDYAMDNAYPGAI